MLLCSGRLLAIISRTFESLVRRWTSPFDKIVSLVVENATRTGHVRGTTRLADCLQLVMSRFRIHRAPRERM